VDKWIEQQLHPEKIDDSALQARLAGFRTLNMDAKAMLQNFPPPQEIKQMERRGGSLPHDPEKRAIYEAAIDKQERKQENKQAKAQDTAQADAQNADPQMMDDAARLKRRAEMREARAEAEPKIAKLESQSPEQRYQAILRMSPEERRGLMSALTPEERQQWMEQFTPQQREVLQALQNPQGVVVDELQQAKVIRAAYSERQLDEVMTDFWFNHFNVFLNKGADRYLVTEYEHDVIRPHALGKFKDLLVATAKSPAMLFYLDNWQSVGPHSDMAEGRRPQRVAYRRGRFGGPFGFPQTRPQQQKAKKNQAGLNENYGREILELHTLGVDGGYTQKDVTEVAKVFTGWTIKQPRQGGGFEFDERRHEPGTKQVLGHKIKEHGEKEGAEVLEILAKHPSTSRFISRKLAIRFVSDNPPDSLIYRMADTFKKTDGDIREVLRTMFRSPEFWAADAYRAKVKTPLEFVVSAVRATGVDLQNAMPLVQALNRMGMPLYRMQPPTGYSSKAEAWVNSAALLNRMNFALALGAGRMQGVKFEPDAMLKGESSSDPQAVVAELEHALLNGDVSPQTHNTILKQMDDPQVTGRALDDRMRPPRVGVIAGLILGSPEFQRR